jgi:hypothetical protein
MRNRDLWAMQSPPRSLRAACEPGPFIEAVKVPHPEHYRAGNYEVQRHVATVLAGPAHTLEEVTLFTLHLFSRRGASQPVTAGSFAELVSILQAEGIDTEDGWIPR